MVAWLKQLNTSEQVALLFVVLFGFLLALTVGLFLNSLRDPEVVAVASKYGDPVELLEQFPT